MTHLMLETLSIRPPLPAATFVFRVFVVFFLMKSVFVSTLDAVCIWRIWRPECRFAYGAYGALSVDDIRRIGITSWREERERVKDLKVYYIKSVARTLFPAMPAGRRL